MYDTGIQCVNGKWLIFGCFLLQKLLQNLPVKISRLSTTAHVVNNSRRPFRHVLYAANKQRPATALTHHRFHFIDFETLALQIQKLPP